MRKDTRALLLEPDGEEFDAGFDSDVSAPLPLAAPQMQRALERAPDPTAAARRADRMGLIVGAIGALVVIALVVALATLWK